ncbi:MAG: TolC family protein [Cytophagales bacterium]|nr:TolC family protein [Cytophagales bacterium]
MRILRIVLVIWLLTSVLSVWAQRDSLHLGLRQADSLLVVRNLDLIATQYQLEASRARVVQARLLHNPELNTEWFLFDPATSDYFNVGPSGQKVISLEQVIHLAGQRNARAKVAAEGVKMSEWQYYEVARAVVHELHLNYFTLYFLNNTLRTLRNHERILSDIVEVYQEQFAKNNVSLRELTRLKSTLFDLINHINQVQKEALDAEHTVSMLLAESSVIIPKPLAPEVELPNSRELNLSELIAKALEARPEIKYQQSYLKQSELDMALQRKLALPDLKTGILYDQAGSAVPNYWAVTAGVEIPLFNRNQGQIKVAHWEMQRQGAYMRKLEAQIASEVERAYLHFQSLYQSFSTIGTTFNQELDQLSSGLVQNYVEKNLSLLEFTDLFESYNRSFVELNNLKINLFNAYEEINYVVGQMLYQ